MSESESESKSKSKSGPRFISFRQLNTLAIMLVLSLTGNVTLHQISILFFSTIYIYLLSKYAFPVQPQHPPQPVFNQKSKFLNRYVLFAAVIGLFLPILYIFQGIRQGDKHSVEAAVPHLFLLVAQVFMEGVSVSSRFSLPIRVFVPVFYNSVRMFTLFEWFRQEFFREDGESIVGKCLAVVNLGFWSFNLFGFLLPVYLPKAFQIYYGSSTGSGSGSGSSSKKD